MLDDLKLIHQRDSRDLLGLIGWQPGLLGEPLKIAALRLERPERPANVLFVGSDQTLAGALMAQAWLNVPVPFETVNRQDLPAYVGSATLCIITVGLDDVGSAKMAYEAARAKGATVIVLAEGNARTGTYSDATCIQLPVRSQVCTTGVVMKTVAAILEAAGLVACKVAEIEAQQTWLEAQVAGWRPDVPTADNQAKQIAQELMGKSVVLYGTLLQPLAYSWKLALNRKAKQVAWVGESPATGLDEILGWVRQPVYKPYGIVELHSSLDSPRTQEYFKQANRLLSGIRPAPIEIRAAEGTVLQQLLYTWLLGEFVAAYLALLNGIDPASSELADKLKERLL
jgi:glucose/mannose-6-phosphate isomerase